MRGQRALERIVPHLDLLSAESTQSNNALPLSSICKLNVPQCQKRWYLLPKITFTPPATRRKRFYTVLLTTQSRFWTVPNFGTKFRRTSLLLFGVARLRHGRSYCWSTALGSWWHMVLLGNPFCWVGYCRPAEVSNLHCVKLFHFLTSQGQLSTVERPAGCWWPKCALELQLPWALKAGSRETSHQHSELGLAAQQLFPPTPSLFSRVKLQPQLARTPRCNPEH